MSRVSLSLVVLVVAALVGCGQAPAPEFKSNMFEIDRASLPVEQQKTIADVLAAMFGTPDEPFVLDAMDLDINKLRLAAGKVGSDQLGAQQGLYRQHCVHCHGITGDGMGPTAAILNPYPRDYRPGKYKYKSTERASMPTDPDLVRILRQGINGTAMPSFDLLAPSEIDALVEYVKYLSLRGQTESALIRAAADLGEGEKLSLEPSFLVDEILKGEADKWINASETIINPPPRPDIALDESIAKGREMFYGAKANCVKCHGPSALGDGQTNDYDDWNKPLAEVAKEIAEGRKSIPADTSMDPKEKAAKLAHLNEMQAVLDASLPIRTILPRNLRLGIYRFGRRPLDLYRRFHSGINGAPMPGGTGTLTPEEMWTIVDYVRSLPNESINKIPRQSAVAISAQ